jgi:hypothetical protein
MQYLLHIQILRFIVNERSGEAMQEAVITASVLGRSAAEL